MRMDEVLKYANDFKPIVLLMTPICVCVVKCLLSNAIDDVFFSKAKQLLSNISKIVFYMLFFWLAYFALGICMVQIKGENNSLVETISTWCFIIVLGIGVLVVIGYIVTICSSVAKKWMQKKRHLGAIKMFCCVAYCAMAVAFFVFEFSCLPMEFNDMNWMEFPRFLLEGLAYISFGFAVLLTGYLCVAIDWLNTISPTRVYVLNEDGKKLYLLYAFDKKTIMCKLENQKRVQEYVPISKQEIINSTIYVECGNEAIEEVESPHQIEEADNRKE